MIIKGATHRLTGDLDITGKEEVIDVRLFMETVVNVMKNDQGRTIQPTVLVVRQTYCLSPAF